MSENAERTTQVALDEPVRRDPDILEASVDGDLVLFDAERGLYFTTQGVGQRIWELLEHPTTGQELRVRLLEEFEVEAETCTRELEDFLGRLAGEGLLVRGAEAAGAVAQSDE